MSPPDGTAPLDRLRNLAGSRQAAGLRRRLCPRPAAGGPLDLAGNDYLGLARDRRITAAAARAAVDWGAGSTGSRLVTGSTELHADLERALARFVGTDDALVCSSGYLANLAAVVALSGPDALVVSDRGNHASLVDACRLSRARVVVTGHGDVAGVERALADRTERVALVVTDAVFSVDGDLAPLSDLHEVTRRHGALLVVDEAHALGVVGDRGRGATRAAGLAGEPDVVCTVTLSKSLGAQGGAVLGAPEVVAHLVDSARAFIFDTGLAPACAGGALAALGVLESAPDLPGLARTNTAALATAARQAGFAVTDPVAAVFPVPLGEPDRAVRAAEICADHGVRVGCFRPPSVPPGGACLRLTGRADLRAGDLDLLADALRAVAKELSG